MKGSGLGRNVLSPILPNDVEEPVEGVIRSINGIGASTRKLHGCIPAIRPLFASLLIDAPNQ
jgi:hypothetical protein